MRFSALFSFSIAILLICTPKSTSKVVVNTWGFKEAAATAWTALERGSDGIDAVVSGCGKCEQMQCDGTVGFGGSPDENGETYLDAMIIDGTTKNAGAVGHLRNIRNAILVAKYVLLYTEHTFLVGPRATEFALQMGFLPEKTETVQSQQKWQNWQSGQCQPNFWSDRVAPNPRTNCGPYTPIDHNDVNFDQSARRLRYEVAHERSHDTIGMVVVDGKKNIIAGTSTNGASFKIPGRIGDSPIIGSGAYADSEFGGAAATGDGDVMMRFLPSFLAVEELRRGRSVDEAAREAIRRIASSFPGFFGGIVVVDKEERVGAACHGMDKFPYSVASSENGGSAVVKTVDCLTI